MTPEIQAAIAQAAAQNGIDPAFALATAERESGGNPSARASRSMYGLFQMSGPLRAQYGVGDSQDPTTQAQGWARFIDDTRGDMAKRLGRDPTSQELYLGHYFGAPRAARMISGQIAPSTDVRDVFTPQELATNPDIAKAGTVGSAVSSIEGDMTKRMAAFGPAKNSPQNSAVAPPIDFASFGKSPTADELTYKSTETQPVNFSAFGTSATEQEQSPEAATLAPEQTPATVGRQRMMMQAMGFGPPPVGGIAAVPGQQPQSTAPLQVPQTGSQLQSPQPVGPVPPATPARAAPQGGIAA